jgi:Flp pilus assembly protein TadG
MRNCRTREAAEGLHGHARGVRFAVRHRVSSRQHRRQYMRWFCRCDGSVAAEFVLVAPVIFVITAGIVDFGLLTAKATALAGAVRIGSEYARLHPADTTGIQNAMQNSMNFSPPLTFPASFPQSCECDDQTSIACSVSCAAIGRPGPNRVVFQISASQAAASLLPWPGFPATLTSTVGMRLQ